MRTELVNRARRLVVQRVPKRHRTKAQSALRPVVGAALHGNAVECPLCEGGFRTFLAKHSASGNWRKGAKCPRCARSNAIGCCGCTCATRPR